MTLARRLRRDIRYDAMDIRRDPLFPDPEDQRRFYETLIEASPTAIGTCDPDFIVTSWNPAAERLFGYTRDEAIGRHIDDLVARSDEIADEAASMNAEIVKGTTEAVTRRTRKDGTLVDVTVRGGRVVIGDQVVAFFALYEDVGELVRQRRYFESIVEMSPSAIIMVNDAWDVTLWNPGAEALFGYTADEAIGRQLDDLVTGDDPEIHDEAVSWSREAWKSDSFRRIGRRIRKDGAVVDVEILAVKVLHDDEPIGYYILYHDVTELEQTRRQLQTRVDEQLGELLRTGELARFLPTQVAEGLLAGQLRPEEPLSRRKITVLFADMVGFTDLSEALEPEELAEVLNGYLREMTAAVVAHGGTLDNFIGDGIMAVFGAPEDVPEAEQAWAAVNAAIEMRTRCRDLATELLGKGIPADLDIRVGINTGHCTVGVFGSEIMRAYKAVGFAVNVASRLQSAAESRSILCGFRTYALIKDRVKADPREPLTVKGASRPVEAWEIVELAE
jgi:PAS domain S-box-containing protein